MYDNFTMNVSARHSIIKRLQTELPRAQPFDAQTLAALGASPQLAARYVHSGWLDRLARGVYAFPGDDLSRDGCVQFLQERVGGLHVGGKSALALQGIRHNLGVPGSLVLWGDQRFALPDWVTARHPARYVSAALFKWPRDLPSAKTLTTPPGSARPLSVSVPERAVLELLYDVGTHESLEEAHNLFGGLRNLRKDLMARLLTRCTSVKAVRLFLTWARETQLVDVDEMRKQFKLPVGSDLRWMSRLKDGTLLTLKPYG